MTELIQEEINTETYEVKPCDTLTLNIASFDDFKNRKILVVLHENSTLDLAFADFSRNSGFVNIDVKLQEKGAKAFSVNRPVGLAGQEGDLCFLGGTPGET